MFRADQRHIAVDAHIGLEQTQPTAAAPFGITGTPTMPGTVEGDRAAQLLNQLVLVLGGANHGAPRTQPIFTFGQGGIGVEVALQYLRLAFLFSAHHVVQQTVIDLVLVGPAVGIQHGHVETPVPIVLFQVQQIPQLRTSIIVGKRAPELVGSKIPNLAVVATDLEMLAEVFQPFIDGGTAWHHGYRPLLAIVRRQEQLVLAPGYFRQALCMLRLGGFQLAKLPLFVSKHRLERLDHALSEIDRLRHDRRDQPFVWSLAGLVDRAMQPDALVAAIDSGFP